MNKLTLLIAILLLLTHLGVHAQDGNWDVYLAQYESGPGSVTLNMDLINIAPNKNLPYVLITGVKFENCRDDGFPDSDEFANLYNISDHVERLLKKHVTSELAGTFTYQCERLDYIYLSDTTSIRAKLSKLYTTSFSNYEYYINIKPDENWEAYTQFLYPNEFIRENMANKKVLLQLQQAGDNLSKERQVDHWLYFASQADQEKYVEQVKALGFKVESKKTDKLLKLPYQLRISRTDYIYPESINKITFELRQKAKDLNGDYDGWETFVIKE